MTVYVLEAYNTDSRYPDDVRYREYTTSKTKAELFNKIPKIQFSDSGHGVVFSAREFTGRRKELRHELSNYVHEWLLRLKPTPKPSELKTLRAKNAEMAFALRAVDSDIETDWDKTKLLISLNTWELVRKALGKPKAEV